MYEIAELTEKSFDITPYQLLVDLKQIDWIEFFQLEISLIIVKVQLVKVKTLSRELAIY